MERPWSVMANVWENSCSGMLRTESHFSISRHRTPRIHVKHLFFLDTISLNKRRDKVFHNQYFGLNILFLSQQHFITLKIVKTDFWSLTARQEDKGHQKLIRFLASQAFFSHAFIFLSSWLLSTLIICKRLAGTGRREGAKGVPTSFIISSFHILTVRKRN